ncbi:MAG: D-aminoacylase [Gemmatimonadaceae bacterium]
MRLRLRFALSVVLIAVGCQPAATPAEKSATGPGQYDVVISGGKIIDGTGNPYFYGDVGIANGRIARITAPGLLANATTKQRVNATGKIVAPGFIDIQAQSVAEFTFGDGRVLSMVTQGVTTAIMGEGESAAPVNGKILEIWKSPGNPYAAAADSLGAKFKNPHGFNSWLEAMAQHGMSENAGSFLGAGTVRVYAKGQAEGAPTPAELDTMRTVVRQAMEDGAMGVASALIYPPGNYAGTAELTEMAKAMSPLGGVYITHMRSEADQFLEAIDEAFAIGHNGGVPVEIFHLKASGTKNWPKMALAIAKIDSARAAGADVGADMYLYTAGGTGLAACAPPWAAADGKLLQNLADPAVMPKIKAAMLHPAVGSEGLCLLGGPGAIQLSGFLKPENKAWEGKRLNEVAASMKKDWVDAWAALVLSEPGVGMLVHMMTESNLPLQLRQPWLKIGTDANGVDPDSVKGAKMHPRTYGNYPRLLGRYVREQKVLTWEEAIRKSTSAVANRLSIRDRGTLSEGKYADVIVFDPNTIIDKATFEDPNQLSVGMEQVFVNGVQVLADGKHTGAKPGKVVRGPGWTGWK